MSGLKVKTLSSLVKVNEVDSEGRTHLRLVGVDTSGQPVSAPATRIVTLRRGDSLPDNLADGELERLQSLGAVGSAEEVAGVAERQLEGEVVPSDTPVAISLDELGAASDAELAALWASKPPKVKELLDTVGGDAALAQRVLAVEKEALKGDSRTSLVSGLEKVIDSKEGDPDA